MKLKSTIFAALLAVVATVVNSHSSAAVVSVEVRVEGALAEDVEASITVPIERFLSGLPSVQVVRSRTSETTSYSEATFLGLHSSESINLLERALRDWKAPSSTRATRPVIKLQEKALLAPSQ